MNWNKQQSRVEQTKKCYPVGTRIELISMEDPYNRSLKPGDKGTVAFVDDMGDIGMDWDNGSTLKLIVGVDSFKIL